MRERYLGNLSLKHSELQSLSTYIQSSINTAGAAYNLVVNINVKYLIDLMEIPILPREDNAKGIRAEKHLPWIL